MATATATLSSNWKALQKTLAPTNSTPKDSEEPTRPAKRRRTESSRPITSSHLLKKPKSAMTTTISEPKSTRHDTSLPILVPAKINEGFRADLPLSSIGKYVAIDCEMVGVGPNPDHSSALARVSLVDFNGVQIYDSYVAPREAVTDYRTHVSGITPGCIKRARTLKQVQADVDSIIRGRILVGHAIQHDLDALLLSHPRRDTRDTSRLQAYRDVAGGRNPGLKMLAKEFLGLEIQTGQHSSVEDARVTMMLFKREKEAFERPRQKVDLEMGGEVLAVKVQRKGPKARRR